MPVEKNSLCRMVGLEETSRRIHLPIVVCGYIQAGEAHSHRRHNATFGTPR